MQRDQFKEKIIKWPNYYQNEYYIIKLCTKNSYNINKMRYISSDPWIPHSKYVNLPIFRSQKYYLFWIFFYYKKETKLK